MSGHSGALSRFFKIFDIFEEHIFEQLKQYFEDDFFTEEVSAPGSALGLHHDLVNAHGNKSFLADELPW